MTDVTWGEVHVGDLVRGSDGRVYRVVEREQGPTWTLTGRHDRYVVERDGQQIKIVRRVTDPAPVIERSDTSYEASAVDALIRGGMTVEIGSERMTEAATTEATEAPQASGGSRCNHPEGKLSRLQNGRIKCTACGRHPRVSAWPHVQQWAAGNVAGAQQEPPMDTQEPRYEQAVVARDPEVVVYLADQYEQQRAQQGAADQFAAPAPPVRPEPPRGKWGWYKLRHPVTGEPDTLWQRVTTIAGMLADRTNLEKWKLRRAVKGLATRKDLIAQAIALDIDNDRDALNGIVESALEAAETAAAANYGTAVHRFAERIDAGETIEGIGVPAELVPIVNAYRDALARNRLRVVPEFSERVVVNADHGYAGKIDRIVLDETDGALRLLDIKTGADVLEYGSLEFGTQQAMYARATHMTTPDYQGYVEMPKVDPDKSLILHIPIKNPGHAAVYCIDLIKGWKAAQLAMSVRDTRRDARNGWMWVHSPADPQDVVLLQISRADSHKALGIVAKQAQERGLWSDELSRVAAERYDVISAQNAPDQRYLAQLWDQLTRAGRWTAAVDEAARRRFDELTAQQPR